MSAAGASGAATAASATVIRATHARTRERRLDVVVALVAAVPPMICMIALDGIPSEWGAWAALIGFVAAGAAVLTFRRHVLLALALLTAAILCVTPADQTYQPGASPWVDSLFLTPLIALALVYCALGSALPLVPSLLLLACSGAIYLWAQGFDVTYVMIALGWWLVGRVLRSRRAVAENLRMRAAELSAERDRYTAEAVRLERTKIARELHDVVAHCMTVIVIQSRAGRHLLGRDPAAAKEALDVIVAVAAEAEADIGALVNLMDPELTRPLTRSLLDELVTRASATGATITAEITGDPADLDPATAVVAHRMVQEAITNAFRHAPGAAIRIVLSGGPVFTLEVTNGPPPLPTRRAATPPTEHDGPAEPEVDSLLDWGSDRGLVGIRERVVGVDGEVTWGATQSGGWRVLARFPTHG